MYKFQYRVFKKKKKARTSLRQKLASLRGVGHQGRSFASLLIGVHIKHPLHNIGSWRTETSSRILGSPSGVETSVQRTGGAYSSSLGLERCGEQILFSHWIPHFRSEALQKESQIRKCQIFVGKFLFTKISFCIVVGLPNLIYISDFNGFTKKKKITLKQNTFIYLSLHICITSILIVHIFSQFPSTGKNLMKSTQFINFHDFSGNLLSTAFPLK